MEEDLVEIEITIKSRDKTKIITVPLAKEVGFDVEFEDKQPLRFSMFDIEPWSIVKAMSLKFVPVADDKRVYGTIKVVDNKP